MLNSIVLFPPAAHIKQFNGRKKGRPCSWIRYKIKYLFRFDSKENNLNAACDCSFLKINKEGERMLWTSYLTFNHYIYQSVEISTFCAQSKQHVQIDKVIQFHIFAINDGRKSSRWLNRVLFKGRQLVCLLALCPRQVS